MESLYGCRAMTLLLRTVVSILLLMYHANAQITCTCDRFTPDSCTVYDLQSPIAENVFPCTPVDSPNCNSYYCIDPITGYPGQVCVLETAPSINLIPGSSTTCEETPVVVAQYETTIWINELHYLGEDQGANFQYVEIVGPVGTVLSGNYRLEFYDGSTRSLYNAINLFGRLSDDPTTGAQGTGRGLSAQTITGTTIRTGFGVFTNGASGNDNDGPANAIALVDLNTGAVSQFISYQGSAGTEFGVGTDGKALDGTATGLVPTPMGVNEVPTNPNGNEESLQLQGTGLEIHQFRWASVTQPETRFGVNQDQVFA